MKFTVLAEAEIPEFISNDTLEGEGGDIVKNNVHLLTVNLVVFFKQLVLNKFFFLAELVEGPVQVLQLYLLQAEVIILTLLGAQLAPGGEQVLHCHQKGGVRKLKADFGFISNGPQTAGNTKSLPEFGVGKVPVVQHGGLAAVR